MAPLFACAVALAVAAALALVLWRRNAPVVVIFGGAYSRRAHFQVWADLLSRCFPAATVLVLSPTEDLGEDWWAEYQPTRTEVDYFLDRGDAPVTGGGKCHSETDECVSGPTLSSGFACFPEKGRCVSRDPRHRARA